MPLSIAKLQLEAKRAALNGMPFKSLEDMLFPESNASSVVRKHLFMVYKNASLDIIKMYAKFMIHEAITKCDTKFIRDVEAANPEILNTQYFKTANKRLKELSIDGRTIKQMNADLWRYINVLIQRFAPRAPEINLRRLIINWFESGEMSVANFEKWLEWKDDLTLAKLKEIEWQHPTENDIIFCRFKDAILAITTDDFVDKKAWKTMMNILLKRIQMEPRYLKIGEKLEITVEISTTILYLSKMKEKLRKMKEELQTKYNMDLDSDLINITEIRIFAKSVFHIDSNLKIPGINFVVVTDRIKVWDKHEIDVSGRNEDSKLLEKAKDGDIGQDGENAKLEAKSGESSGNILMVTLALTPDLLTLKLNGGNGQRGQDGGDGGNGKNGIGIEEKDFNDLIIKYESIYFTKYNHFFAYKPKGWKEMKKCCDEKDHYVYAEYEEKKIGRKIYYSYSAYKALFFLPTSYELYFYVEGTTGKPGGKGGENGFGGSGGNCGECNSVNPSSTEKFKVAVITEPGKTGEDGLPGYNGNYGINGRDMAMTDKSKISKIAKSFYGNEDDVKLTRKYDTIKGERNVYDGAKKVSHVYPSECFAYFTESKIEAHALKKERREAKTRNEAEKKNESKKSIVMSEIMNKASDLFTNDNASLTAVCQPQTEYDNDEEIEKESQASVAEETSVLQERKTKALLISKKHLKENVKNHHSSSHYTNLFLKLFSFAPKMGSLNQHKKQLFSAIITTLKIKISINSMEELLENELNSKIFQKLNVFVIPLLVKKCSEYINCQEIRAYLLQYGNYNLGFLNKLPQCKEIFKQKEEYANFRKNGKECFYAYANSHKTAKVVSTNDKNNFIYNVKFVLNDEPPINPVAIRQYVEEFFKWHADNELNLDFLEYAYTAWEKVSSMLKDIKEKEIFEDLDFNWNDELAEPKFLAKYFPDLKKSWFERATAFRKSEKKAAKEASDKKIEDDQIALTSETEEDLRNLDEVEDENVLKTVEKTIENSIMEDSKASVAIHEMINKINAYLNKNGGYKCLNTSFQSWRKLLKDDIYLEFKFGKVPEFKNPLNVFHISYLIKFYYQINQILIFQRRLHTVTNFIHKKTLVPTIYADNIEDFGAFIQKAKNMEGKNVSLSLHEMKQYMIAHGANCAALRYLWAYVANKNIRVYGNEVFGKMELMESFNEDAKECISFGVIPGCCKVFPVSTDRDLQQLNEHRKTFSSYFTDFKTTISNLKVDFMDETFCITFSSYFPFEYHTVVCEWISKYIASTADQTLLKLLYHRFSIDQNHMDLSDFQFILNTAMALYACNEENFNFVFAIAATFKQKKLSDAFLYILIETTLRRKMKNSNNFPAKIFKILKKIKTNILKSLLASKLHEAKLDEEILIRVLNMLCHTSDSQLIKMSLSDWIEIAKHQNWSDAGKKFDKMGKNLGYYLSFLNYQRHPASTVVRKLFKNFSNTYENLLEKFIAKLVFLINQNEIQVIDKNVKKQEASAELVKSIENILTKIKTFTPKDAVVETFITDQKMSNEIMKKIKDQGFLSKIFPTGDRNLAELKTLMLNSDANSKDNVKPEELEKYFAALEDDENNFYRWIEEIDKVLYVKRNKLQLRDTQKLAIISSIMGTSLSDSKRFLAQVNTGEGKSFIIAAISIIQAKIHGTVDIITSSSVLAKRDSEEMADIYEAFGLTVGHNCDENVEKRKIAYKANIVYGDIASFQRDFLLHTFYKKNILGDRQRKIVIVDEVDNMLLDNGNNMLYLSHQISGMERMDSLFVFIHKLVHAPLINAQMKTADIEKEFDTKMIKEKVMYDLVGKLDMSDLVDNIVPLKTIQMAWNKLNELGVIDREGYLNNFNDAKFELVKKEMEDELLNFCPQVLVSRILVCLKVIVNREKFIFVPDYLKDFCILHLDEYIESCKKSMFLKHKNEYVVDVDHTKEDSDLQPKVTIIDQNTGVDLANSQWSEGLHQSVQLKHGCRLLPVTLKAVFISNVLYLKGYEIINGLSGTLGSAEESHALADLYKAKLIRIPTSKLKDFYEKVPIICKNEKEWAEKIYIETENMITAKRSVLIICQSISEVEKLQNKFEQICESNPTLEMKICINSAVIYTRDFHSFNYNGDNTLKAGKLIISTNLAGRGTDIKLDDEVKENGGLHVIITFLPENCRIEEQAFGRASRSGDPGSAQIITLDKDEQNTVDVFQLKEFRDNAEVHRLKSLKNFYQFHTKIEELCLDKFRKYCAHAFENISQTNSADEDILPNEQQVKYFAFLDSWALWLDRKSQEIKHCAETCNEAEKNAIIESVDEFLKTHLEDEALTWIKAPQSLLTIALLNFENEEKCKEFLDQVGERFPEYLDDALYYRALLEQRHIRRPKSLPKDVHILKGLFAEDKKFGAEFKEKWSGWPVKEKFLYIWENGVIDAAWAGTKYSLDYFTYGLSTKAGKFIQPFGEGCVNKLNYIVNAGLNPINDAIQNYAPTDYLIEQLINIDEKKYYRTQEFFHFARQHYALRLDQREDAVQIVSALQGIGGPNDIRVNGFVEQSKQIKRIIECIIANIDTMVGEIIDWHTFNHNNNPANAYRIYSILKSQGFISQPTLCFQEIPSQLKAIKHKYFISKKLLTKTLKEIRESQTSETFNSIPIMSKDVIKEKISMPSREGFWEALKLFGCFKQEKQCFHIDETRMDKVTFLDKLVKLTVEISPFALTLSNSSADRTLYCIESLEKMVKNKEVSAEELDCLIEEDIIVQDCWAIINLERYFQYKGYLGDYKTISAKDLANYLEVEEKHATKIIMQLANAKIFEPVPTKMRRLNEFYKPKPTKIAGISYTEEFMKIFCEKFAKIENISDEFIQIEFDLKTSTQVLDAISTLEKESIVEVWKKLEYFPVSGIDCTILPKCFRADVEGFLMSRCSYDLAYNALSEALLKSIPSTDEEIKNVQKTILLPWKPYNDLYQDFIKHGIIMPPRFFYQEEKFVDFSQFEDSEAVEDIVNSRKSMLTQQSSERQSTNSYFQDKSVNAPPEVKQTVTNSLKQVATIKKNNVWKWYLVIGIFVGILLAAAATAILLTPFAALIVGSVGLLISLIVLAAYGTVAYFNQMFRAQSRISIPTEKPNIRNNQNWIDQSTAILTYHEAEEMKHKNVKNNAVLIQTINNVLNDATNSLQLNYLKFIEIDESSEIMVKNAIEKCDKSKSSIERAINISIDNSSNFRFIIEQYETLTNFYFYTLTNKIYDCLKSEYKHEKFDVIAISKKLKYMDYKKFGNELDEVGIKSMVRKFAEDFEDALKQKSDQEDSETIVEEINVEELMKIWKSKLSELLHAKIQRILTSIFNEPTKELLSQFIENNNEEKNKQSKAKNKSIEAQILEKQKINDKSIEISATKHITHIRHEAKNILKTLWNIKKDVKILIHMIQYDYALPISSFSYIGQAISTILEQKTETIKFCRIFLLDKKQKHLIEYFEKYNVKEMIDIELPTSKGNYILVNSLKKKKVSKSSAKCSLIEILEERLLQFENIFPSGLKDFKQFLINILQHKNFKALENYKFIGNNDALRWKMPLIAGTYQTNSEEQEKERQNVNSMP